MAEDIIAVTREEFVRAFRQYHKGAVPERVYLNSQEWDDLDAELEDAGLSPEALAETDHYAREPFVNSYGLPGVAWVRHRPFWPLVHVSTTLVMEDGGVLAVALERRPERENLWMVLMRDLARLECYPEVGPFGSEGDARAWLFAKVEREVGRIVEVRRVVR